MRRAAVFFVCLVALGLAAPAHAGTYLDAASMMLDESHRALDAVQRHVTDTKLAGVARSVADARVRAGRLLVVPKEAEPAHPHLLLALESAERAFAAASEGDSRKFLRLAMTSRDEERTMRAVLAESHLALPDPDRSR